MTSENALSSVSQIFELLEQEKNALIDGDVQALQTITQRKQDWIDALPDAPLTLEFEQIRKIKDMSEQNAALSQACQAAQKSVLSRLGEIRKIQKTMGIYGVDGSFSEAKDPPPKIEARS